MFLLLNMLSRLVIALLSRSKHLLISWMQSPSAEAQEDKGCYCLHCFPIYKPWSDGTGCHDLHFVKAEPAFSLSSFTFIKGLFSSSSVSAIRVVSSAYLRLLIFLPAGASLVAQRLKSLPAMQETWVWSLGREDPLEKEMATHSNIFAWRIPWTEEPGGLQSTGHKESDTTEWLHFHFHLWQKVKKN